MANVDVLADTRKARLTPARLTRDRVRTNNRKATKVGFNPGGDGREVRAMKHGRTRLHQFGPRGELPIMK